jgi:hypothetical protein
METLWHMIFALQVWEFDRFNEWSHGVGYLSRAISLVDSLWRSSIRFS